MELVDDLDQDEDDKGNQEEVNNILNEVTIGNGGTTFAAKEIRNGNAEAGKVEAAADKADQRHDDIVNDWSNDGRKGRADDDTYSEVHDITAIDEVGKFFAEAGAFAASFLEELLSFFGGFFFWHKFSFIQNSY